MFQWIKKVVVWVIAVLGAVLLISAFSMSGVASMVKTPIDGLISRFDKSKEDYSLILATGGRLIDENLRKELPASLLNISHEYLIKKGEINKQGYMPRGTAVEVLLPDFKPSKPWQLQKGKELAERFPEEFKNGKKPKKKEMSPELRQAYDEITEKYAMNRVAISIGSARDVYSAKFSWEGTLSKKELERLQSERKYHGPISESRGHLQNHPKLEVVKKVGKYGEGKWPYRDGLGRDFVKQESNPKYELWEYGEYTPVGSRNPMYFYYVPVVPEKPHQIYIQCGWNGNVDYIERTNCKAESVLDETIAYSFSFRRPRLNEYHKINQQVVALLKSFIVDKGSLAELLELEKNKQK